MSLPALAPNNLQLIARWPSVARSRSALSATSGAAVHTAAERCACDATRGNAGSARPARTPALLGGACALLLGSASQAVELPRMFADGMVLQRGQAIPIWGHARPGANVEVRLEGDAVSTIADGNGAWR